MILEDAFIANEVGNNRKKWGHEGVISLHETSYKDFLFSGECSSIIFEIQERERKKGAKRGEEEINHEEILEIAAEIYSAQNGTMPLKDFLERRGIENLEELPIQGELNKTVQEFIDENLVGKRFYNLTSKAAVYFGVGEAHLKHSKMKRDKGLEEGGIVDRTIQALRKITPLNKEELEESKNVRKTQLMILKSGLRYFKAAYETSEKPEDWGTSVEEACYDECFSGRINPDMGLRLASAATILGAEREVKLKAGENPADRLFRGSFKSKGLLRIGATMYEEAFQRVNLGDLMTLYGVKKDLFEDVGDRYVGELLSADGGLGREYIGSVCDHLVRNTIGEVLYSKGNQIGREAVETLRNASD
jgi:hypothetical protein